MAKIKSPFIPEDHEVVGQGDWDTDYVELEHKVVVKKTGEGEDDYVLTTKHIVHKTPIAEVVARDAGTCSIQAIIANVLRTGDTSLLPTPHPKDGVVNDITGVPDNLLDLDNQMKAMEAKFNALPDTLKKGRSFGEFCELINQEEFMQFIASITPKKEDKKGEEKEGDK